MAIPELLKKALKAGSRLGDSFGDGFDIFEINVDLEGTTVIRALKKAGLKNAAADIENKLSKEASISLNYLSKLALQAAKSTVPIKSGTLRNENIILSDPAFRAGSSGARLTRTVSIQGDHNPPYRNSEVNAVKLALVLNTEQFSRSRISQPSGPFHAVDGGTHGWIEYAQNEFRKNKGKLLLSRFS